jgi:hypothetical protein
MMKQFLDACLLFYGKVQHMQSPSSIVSRKIDPQGMPKSIAENSPGCHMAW